MLCGCISRFVLFTLHFPTHIVGLKLDPNCLTLMVLLKEFFEKINFEKKNQQTTKMHTQVPIIANNLYISAWFETYLRNGI